MFKTIHLAVKLTLVTALFPLNMSLTICTKCFVFADLTISVEMFVYIELCQIHFTDFCVGFADVAKLGSTTLFIDIYLALKKVRTIQTASNCLTCYEIEEKDRDSAPSVLIFSFLSGSTDFQNVQSPYESGAEISRAV